MTVDSRMHRCPACGKQWKCLAESPAVKDHRPSRPLWECIFPLTLTCPACAREGR